MLVEPPREEHSHVPVNSAPGTGGRIAVAVVLLAALLAAGFFYRYHKNNAAQMSLASDTLAIADAPLPVDVVKVTHASPVHELTLPGEARAWYQSTIYARVSGYIGTWKRDIGDKVKKGEVLALIDTPELDDQLNAALAKVAAENAEVSVAEANEAFADTTYKRWKESGKGVVSEQEREEKKAEFLSAQAHLKAVRSQVDLDQAEVKRLRDLASFKQVVAPYDGVITSRRVDIGDLVTAGSTSGNTPLFDIAHSDRIRVYVEVPQAASADVKDGTVATATVQEDVDHVFTGKVARNSESIDDAAKTLKVEVDFDNTDLALKPGMYLSVTFKTTDARPPLQVPASALSFRTSGPTVAVVGRDGKVQFRSVSIVRDLGNVVEIGSGVRDGERVALNISNQIASGDKVQAVEEDGASNPSPPPPANKAPAVAARPG